MSLGSSAGVGFTRVRAGVTGFSGVVGFNRVRTGVVGFIRGRCVHLVWR